MSSLVFARLIHIVFGATWVGIAVFLSLFLLPALRAVGPAGGAVMQHLAVVRRLPLYMMLITVVTILSGGWLMWHDAGVFGMEWFHQGAGRMFGTGATLAIIAAIIGMSVNTPAAKRLGTLSESIQQAGRAPSPAEQAEMQALGKRLAIAAMLVMVLVVCAAATMSMARALG